MPMCDGSALLSVAMDECYSPRMKLCMLGNAVHCEQVRVVLIVVKPTLADSKPLDLPSWLDVLPCRFQTEGFHQPFLFWPQHLINSN